MHWKASHKAVCSGNAAVTRSFEGSPEEKGRSKKMRQWMNAWIPTISYCLPMALDLANHEWGRHDTHAYVISILGLGFAYSDTTATISLVMFVESTGLSEAHQSFRVGKFHACLNSPPLTLIHAIPL